MAIRDGPSHERPRERLLSQGAQYLSNAELLAIFLRTGIPGRSAVDLARDLINTFGGLRPLLEASAEEFCKGDGLGLAKYAQLQAVLEMARRCLLEDLQRGQQLTSPSQTKEYLRAQLRSYSQEVFACLYLDNQHRVIVFEELFFGTIDSAQVYPREVAKRALHHHAAAVIFAHNHPSGIAEPSRADVQITRRLIQALELFDIRVLDHLIVGDREVISLAERGQLG